MLEGLEGRALLATAPVDLTLTGGKVLENSAVGTEVGRFATIDVDVGDTFTYALVAGTGGEDNASFSIQSNRLLATTPFDYEFKHQYHVRVRSTDSTNGSIERLFTITVQDVDDFPTSSGMTPLSQADPVNYIELGARVDPLNDQSASGDGARLVYTAQARNLASGQLDLTTNRDVFLYSPLSQSNTLTLVSRGVDGPASSADGDSRNARISADGRFVAFESNATNLIPGQSAPTGGYQIYLYEVSTGSLTLVTRATTAATTPSNGAATLAGISDDGSRVVFSSSATNLISGQTDANAADDVFLYDRSVGSVRLVSRSSASASTTANGRSNAARISGDGSTVVYATLATNLAAGVTDANGQDDVWLYNVATGANSLVSHAASGATTAANNGSFAPSVSDDGTVVAFESAATNLVTGQIDGNGARDVFRLARGTNTNTLVSHASGTPHTAANGASTGAALSGGGQFIAYQSTAKNLTPGLGGKTRTDEDVFVHSFVDDLTTLVSHNATNSTNAGNGRSWQPSITDDGNYVGYLTQASDLVEGENDANGTAADAMFYDLVADASQLLNASAADPFTSADGAADSVFVTGLSEQASGFAFFTSTGSDLLTPILDNRGTRDAFVFDSVTQIVDGASRSDLLSPATTSTGGGSASFSQYAATDDERYWVYLSPGVDIVLDTVGTPPLLGVGSNQVYLFDRITFGQQLVSHAAADTLTVANGVASTPLLAGDSGNPYVAYASTATNVIAGQVDSNGATDVFLYDSVANVAQLVSRQAGTANTAANGASRPLAISQNGRYVLFASTATNLVVGQTDSNGGEDLFLYDKTNNTVVLVSHLAGSNAATANAPTTWGTMSIDGQSIAFATGATNVVVGQSDLAGTSDVFLYQTSLNTSTLVSRSFTGATIAGNGASTQPRISELGNAIVFLSTASNLLSGVTDSNSVADVFLYDAPNNQLKLVSRASGGAGTTTGNFASLDAVVNSDGTHVLYSTNASNVVAGVTDVNSAADLVLFDVATNAAELVTRQASSSTATASGGGIGAIAISDDGAFVAYDSTMTGLVARPPGPAGSREVYHYDAMNDTTTRATNRPFGTAVTTSQLAGFGSSGQFASLASDSDTLVDWDYDFLGDAFLWQAPGEPVNHAPTDISLSSTQVDEQLPVGTVVGTLATSDVDVGESFTYELVGGPGGDDNGSFAINGSSLVTNAVFTQATKSSYQVRLRSTDSAGDFVEESFTITITGAFNGPTNITLSRAAVSEMLRGATVGVVTVVDPDPNATHVLTTSDARFAFTGNTLKLKTTEFLRRSTATTVTLTITATDGASTPHVFNKQFTLDVLANPHPWQNPANALDVSDDTFVAPQDALIVINELNDVGPHELLPPIEGQSPPPPWFDSDGDNFVAPLDALLIINFLNAQSGPEGEEAVAAAVSATEEGPTEDGADVTYVGFEDGDSDGGSDEEIVEEGDAGAGGGGEIEDVPVILATAGGSTSWPTARGPVAMNLFASSARVRLAQAPTGALPVYEGDEAFDLDPLDDVLDVLAEDQVDA